MPNAKRNLSKLARAAQRVPEQPRTTAEQIGELYRRLLYIADPVFFCIDALKWTPDPWQRKLLGSKSRKIIVNVARQQGKSTTAAAKAVHRCVLFPKSVVLIVAPAVPQAGELRRKIDDHLRNLKMEVQVSVDNKRELEFENGSRIIIVAADEDTVRSYTADMILEDEAALVADAVYEAMEPMLLTTGGQHILLGTPKGKKDHHFPSIWHDVPLKGQTNEWDRYEVTAWQNSRIPKGVLQALRDEKERRGKLWWFQQEYECSFVAAAQGLCYPWERVKNSSPALALDRGHGWQYVLGIDYGYNDSTAFAVLGWQRDDPCVYIIESMDKRGLTPSEAAALALAYTKKYPFARMIGDTGGLGKGYVEEARRRYKLPIQPAEKNNKRGYIEIMSGDMRMGLIKTFPGNNALTAEWQGLPWDEEREMPAEGHKDHISDAALYAYRETLHFLEEIRKEKPAKGTKAAFDAEADALFNERLVQVRYPDKHRRLSASLSTGYLTKQQYWDELASLVEQMELSSDESTEQAGGDWLQQDAGETQWLDRMNETSFLN